jgi:hypothetical protein
VLPGDHGWRARLRLLARDLHAICEAGDSRKTAAEVHNLGLVIHEIKGSRAGENDVFIVGDFNLVP